MSSPNFHRTPNRGFTLVELVIVVAVIAILAAFAMPAYQRYVISTNRANVQAEMLQIAQRLESRKVTRGSYTGSSLADPSIYGSTLFPKTGKALYDLQINADQRDGLVTGWVIEASPRTDGIQQGNGVIRLNEFGHKCWVKAATTCTLSANSNWSEN